ncbi:hypothetical protein FSP39_003451 [Pinctada imbricata]|uniref:SOCS box domain-containing protein n=1 Tax=Pinctada imbricata TaxID=66713 RepID=A0AA88XHF1_PINIB|nr:hypothetical protein FSP39_003451 [Pinctada imbricata]
MGDENNVSFTLQEYWKAIEEENIDFIRVYLHKYARRYDHRDVNKGLCLAAKKNSTEIVRVILTSPKTPNLNYLNENGSGVMHYAVEHGNIEMVGLLLDSGALINSSDIDGFQPLHIAMRYGHANMVIYLIKRGAHTYAARTIDKGFTPLHVGVHYQKLEAMKALLETGKMTVNVKTPLKQGWQTSLHLAAKSSFYEGFALLCQWDADLSAVDANGLRPIHSAASSDDPRILEFLLKKGVDVEAEDHTGRRPIHCAVYSKRVQNVKLLIQHGVNVRTFENSGLLPLHGAVLCRSNEIVKLLLNAGADPNARTKSPREETPLLIAASLGHTSIAETLLQAGGDAKLRSANNTTTLHKCQKMTRGEDRDRLVGLLIQYGAELNVFDKDRYTPLHNCVFQTVLDNFSFSTMSLLVQAGTVLHPGCKYSTDTSSPWPIRNSPLCWLVWRGYIDSADYLVRSGWDVRGESWMYLPGKNEEQNKFHEMMRKLSRDVYPLTHLCRKEIRKIFLDITGGSEILSRINCLPLAPPVKDFLSLKERELKFT